MNGDATGPVAKNVRRIAHMDIPGGGQIVAAGGYAYIGHMAPPHGTSILDVSDPQHPRVIASIALHDDRSHSHKVRVTGDLMEALTMSDLVAVMDRGRIVQEAPPAEIYRAPKEKFVANFIGLANFFEGEVKQTAAGDAGIGAVETTDGMLNCVLPDGVGIGDRVVVVVRPEDIHLRADAAGGGENLFEGEVKAALFTGASMEYQIALKEVVLRVKLHSDTPLGKGERVCLELPAGSCRALSS